MFFVRNTVKADGFAYVSQYAKEEAEKYYRIGQGKNSVLGNPINLSVFSTEGESPSGEDRRLFRERLGLHGFGGMCLNVSLDEPRKNLETFLNMARLRENVAFVRIGKLTPRLQTLIERMHLKNVFHFSAIPTNALRSFYRHADLFVFPSWVEGFGLPPLEALACGTLLSVPILRACTKIWRAFVP